MNVSASLPSGTKPRKRIVKSGSVQLKVYQGTNRGKPCYTVYWRIGGRPFRKIFFDGRSAEKYAKDKAEALAAGQVNSPSISVADAETYRGSGSPARAASNAAACRRQRIRLRG